MYDEARQRLILEDLTRNLVGLAPARVAGYTLGLWSLPVLGNFPFSHARWLLSIDDFLSAVSILQVARTAAAVPRALPPQLTKFLRRVLSNPSVPTICRERSLALPLMLRNSVLDGAEEETSEPVDPALFQWYLDLRLPVDDDREIREFLKAASHHPPGGLHWDDRTSPEILGRLLTENARELNIADRIGLGFFGFCRYCDEFVQLMRSSDRLPLFQAAIWHSHLGWAAEYERLRDALLTGIQALAQLKPTNADNIGSEAVEARFAHLAEVANVLFRDPPMPDVWSRTWSEAGMPQRV